MEFGISFDIRFIFRTIRKWFFSSACIGIVFGVFIYIGADLLLTKTYSASTIVAVLSSQTNTSSLAERTRNLVTADNERMWNSQLLRMTIDENYPDLKAKGRISGRAVSGTNLVRITVSADSSESAFDLMQATLNSYTKVNDYFEPGYYVNQLTSMTGSSIRVSRDIADPKLLAVLAVIGTVAGCCGLLGVWCLFTTRLHSENQAEDLLAVDVLDALPVKGKKQAMELNYIEAMDRLSARVEQYIRRHKHKILMVSSVSPNEGKSTICVELAENLASKGKKVLLVDLDIRNPSIWKLLNLDKAQDESISTSLLEKKSLRDVVGTIESYPGLNVICQGIPVEDADRLLEVSNLRRELQNLSNDYDCIIIDTPPSGLVRDCEVISEAGGTLMFVFRQDQAVAGAVNDCIGRIETHGVTCMGAVLNASTAYRRIRNYEA